MNTNFQVRVNFVNIFYKLDSGFRTKSRDKKSRGLRAANYEQNDLMKTDVTRLR